MTYLTEGPTLLDSRAVCDFVESGLSEFMDFKNDWSRFLFRWFGLQALDVLVAEIQILL